MKHYERPIILATYSVEEVVEEAAICLKYGGSGPVGPGPGGRPPINRRPRVGPAILPDTGAGGLAGGGFSLGSIVTGISLLAAGGYIRLRRR